MNNANNKLFDLILSYMWPHNNDMIKFLMTIPIYEMKPFKTVAVIIREETSVDECGKMLDKWIFFFGFQSKISKCCFLS